MSEQDIFQHRMLTGVDLSLSFGTKLHECKQIFNYSGLTKYLKLEQNKVIKLAYLKFKYI